MSKEITPENVVFGGGTWKKFEDMLEERIVYAKTKLETCEECKLKEYQLEIKLLKGLLVELQNNKEIKNGRS